MLIFQTGTDIEKDEANIISGALQLSKKTVTSVMTKLEDVYMLSYDTILDFETVSEIMNSGGCPELALKGLISSSVASLVCDL